MISILSNSTDSKSFLHGKIKITAAMFSFFRQSDVRSVRKQCPCVQSEQFPAADQATHDASNFQKAKTDFICCGKISNRCNCWTDGQWEKHANSSISARSRLDGRGKVAQENVFGVLRCWRTNLFAEWTPHWLRLKFFPHLCTWSTCSCRSTLKQMSLL